MEYRECEVFFCIRCDLLGWWFFFFVQTDTLVNSVPEDATAWLANRRRLYPSKARIAEKEAEEAERKAAQAEEDVKRREKEEQAKELEKQASLLRKQLRKVESSIKRKREQHDEGDELRDDTGGESESDDQPEAMSSNAPEDGAGANAPKADVNQPCKYFATGATCGKGSKCRFVHDQAARDMALREKAANGDKHTIRQRLVLNDKCLEDSDVLETILHLRDVGNKDAQSRVSIIASQQEALDVAKQQKLEQSLTLLKPGSSLPARPPSLPEKPKTGSVGGGSGASVGNSTAKTVAPKQPVAATHSQPQQTVAKEEPDL